MSGAAITIGGFRHRNVDRSLSFLDGFWLRVDTAGDCWIWRGGRLRGYGFYAGRRGFIFAHRLSWELAHAEPVPRGLFVLHRCDNPPCVNPAHLFIGTNKDNVLDMCAKGRSHNARLFTIGGETLSMATWAERRGVSKNMVTRRVERGWPFEKALAEPLGSNYLPRDTSRNLGPKNPNAKLTEEMVREIRAIGHTQTRRQVALRFGLHVMTVSQIRSGSRWGHVK